MRRIRKSLILLVFLLAFSLLFFKETNATVIVINTNTSAVNNSWVQNGVPNTNHATDSQNNVIQVLTDSAGDMEGYIKFNLTSLNVASINSAILSLYATDAHRSTNPAMYEIIDDASNDAWLQNTITYNNQPCGGSMANGNCNTTAGNPEKYYPVANHYNNYTITSLANRALNRNSKTFTVVIYNTSGGFSGDTWMDFASSRNSSTYAPLLYLDYLSAGTLNISSIYDEKNLSSICYNYVVSNNVNSVNGFSCGNVILSNVPQGNDVITFSNNSYVSRTYYLTINSGTNANITGYFLDSTSGVNINTFTYSLAQPSGIQNVLETISKFINSAWTPVSQILSDAQGKGLLYLNPTQVYQIIAVSGTQSTTISNYVPNAVQTLLLPLGNFTSPSNLTWVFDQVSIIYTPTYSYFDMSSLLPFSYQITDSVGDLTNYRVNLTGYLANGTGAVLYTGNGNAGSGATLAYNLNAAGLTNYTYYTNLIAFTRSGYQEWNWTYNYYPYNNTKPGAGEIGNYSLNTTNYANAAISWLGNFTGGTGGVQSTSWIMLVAVISSMGVALIVARGSPNFGVSASFGASIVFILMLSMFQIFGLFNGISQLGQYGGWGLIMVLGVIVLGINLALRT